MIYWLYAEQEQINNFNSNKVTGAQDTQMVNVMFIYQIADKDCLETVFSFLNNHTFLGFFVFFTQLKSKVKAS